MKKEGITREAAEVEAAKYGVTIPEEQFVVVQTKKGRKSIRTETHSDAESEQQRCGHRTGERCGECQQQ